MRNQNTQYITLDLNFSEMKAVKFKQYNKGSQKIILTIAENGQPFPLDSASMKCYFKMITPAHTHKFNDENVSINDDGTVTVNIKESYCLTAGTARAELNIVNTVDETQICTMNFNIIVEGSVYDNHIIEDCDDFSALTKVLTENEHRKENLILLDKNLREADDVRMANENIRISNEETRISNENTRISNENTRISNENDRMGNENNRENAEQKREDDFSTAITNADTATQNANTAAADADQATQNATAAADRAGAATQNANTAIEEMRALMANDNILHVNQLGAAGGVATLDEEGFLSASQIPDRTIEYYYGTLDKETQTFTSIDGEPLPAKINKCYVDTHTNLPYIWSGTEFVATGTHLALGTTSATAFPGDRGVSLEHRVTGIEEYHNNIPAADIKFSNSNTNLSGANVQAAIEDLTATATPLRNGLLSADDKKRIDSYANITEIPITLSASSWTGTDAPYTQTVAVAELQSYNNCCVEIHPDATPAQENALLESKIEVTSYSETSGLSFSAVSKPPVDIPILLCAGASMNIVNVPKYLGETPVTGIKGSRENTFRQGMVNLTPENLGALPADGDSQNNTVTFSTVEASNSWTDVADLASGEKHSSLFHKLSTTVKNMKYLYRLLGTTNITSIGNGTVTGALDKLNNIKYAASDSIGGAANYLNANWIPPDTDLNNLTTPGFYYNGSNADVATFKNCPTGDAFFLIVGKHAGVYQELVTYPTASPIIYMRNFYLDTWGSWQHTITSLNISSQNSHLAN
ncbi:MAG: BppU family phage baseplate upper protein [Lachnospiraceae bacterium]|nr:BppU family phage baseplate upper protein [Lachnospiraceae bacterium]